MYAWPSVDVPSLAPSTDVPDRLSLFDSATGGLIAADPSVGSARMYVCGITPYDATHLGHANTYLAFDMMNRTWRDLGLVVDYTQNVTDVDDPLIERAKAIGQEWDELAADQIELFRSDMTALRVIPPDHYIGAVEAISQVVELIEQLLPSGLVYQLDDPDHPDWYFNTTAAPGFGGVSGLSEAEMITIFAERGGDPEREGKRHPLDCLLWQFARPGEPSWASPLGAGRPGWHIECTAIALHHLGPNFDVQGGGSDLIFPHHEMCAAQAYVASGEPFADAFVHSGMVALDGEKMSKSKGNLELVSRLRHQGVDPMVIRVALLGHHYRSDWEWTAEQIEAAQVRLVRWRAAASRESAMSTAETLARMRTALRNDLNVPEALDAVDAWASASLAIDSDDSLAPQEMALAIDALLGVQL